MSQEFETVIGLEVHAQLLTRSKMFCGCSAEYAGAPPNTHVCPICLGMPGTLPVINRRALASTIITGLALHCEIPSASKFDRKNYPYPDLPKGYQISQYDLPLSKDGWTEVGIDGDSTRVGMERVHLEEDTAKLTHIAGGSLIDFNRSGVPLMEIVSKPDLRSPTEARAYLHKLRAILRTLGVSTGNMEEGSFRCDANISLRPLGSDELGAKVEVKNMNSFRSVQRALEFEVARQTQQLERGQRVAQETRGWLEDRGITVSQRSKEFAHDYRYFPEPDLPPVFVSREWVAELKASLPELPDARRERFVQQYGLGRYDAAQLTASRATADFFEETTRLYPEPKKVSNWIQSELFRLQKAGPEGDGEALGEGEADETSSDCAAERTGELSPHRMAELLRLIDRGTLSTGAAKQVFETMYRTGREPAALVEQLGLAQVSDEAELERMVDEVLNAQPQAVVDYRSGKSGAVNFLAGQVMKASRGKANPNLARDMIQRRLSEPGR
jgi:aspartyl-tRNA(Asn)/glutamyl-tRNA(Gln) amidotransferase subunit B